MTPLAGVMLVLGLAGMAVSFAINSSTPMQLGPVPFFASAAFAFIGFVALISRAFR